MPRLYPEALAFCILWAGLAVLGYSIGGWQAGALLSAGLFVIVMPSSAAILSKTGSFALERGVRWAILAVAALLLLAFARMRG